MMTPYEKFKSLLNAEQYLREGLNFKMLDEEAFSLTDLEAAKQMHEKRKLLFSKIFSQ